MACAVFGDNQLAFVQQKVALRLINTYHILINEGIKCFFLYTGYTQKNGAVSKVNKKLTSHLTRAQRTPSAAETVQVSAADGVRCARVK